jgi:hypothetical protein
MIGEQERYHGVVLARIVRCPFPSGASVRVRSQGRSAYLLDECVALYVKYSTSRLSPWSFSFAEAHQAELDVLAAAFDHTLVALVCGEDGVACLTWSEFKNVLDDNYEPIEWIKVSRKARQQYTVKGSDNRRGFKVADSEFPAKVWAVLRAENERRDRQMQ